MTFPHFIIWPWSHMKGQGHIRLKSALHPSFILWLSVVIFGTMIAFIPFHSWSKVLIFGASCLSGQLFIHYPTSLHFVICSITCLCSYVANIANNMDQDQTAPSDQGLHGLLPRFKSVKIYNFKHVNGAQDI